MKKDQNYQLSQEASERFDAIQDQMERNNVQEEENNNNIRSNIYDIGENGNASTRNNTGINQEAIENAEASQDEESKKDDSKKLEESEEFSEEENHQNHQNQNPTYCYLMGETKKNEIKQKAPKKTSRNFVNKKKFLKRINKNKYQKKYNPPISSTNQMNSMSSNPQTYTQATLIYKIRIAENKIIAIYKAINLNNIYVYEYTIGNNPNAYVDWFFPKRADAYSYIYDYIRQNMHYGWYI